MRHLIKQTAKMIGYFLLVATLIAAVPVVGYFSVGWLALPTPEQQSVPQFQKLEKTEFSEAAAQALQALTKARASQQLPSLTVAVMHQGQFVWAAGSGYADVEQQLPVTPQSQFRIGSTSKAVTATVLARLLASGQLDLEQPISRYQTQLPNPAWQTLTLRQLMSHTAGLPSYETNDDWRGVWHSWVKQKHYDDVDAALEIFDNASLQYKAGEDFMYTSFDVNLASSVMQHAAGQPFLSLLASQVTEPLALPSIRAADAPYPAQVQFYQQKTSGQVKPHWPVDLSQKWAGGGLAASSVDLARLGAAWLDPAFIPTAIQQQFWTVQRLNNGEKNEQNYGLGWRVSQRPFLYCDQANPLSKELRYIHHGGVSDGAQSWLVVYPDYQLVLAMNTNTVKEDYCDFAGHAAAIIKPFLRTLDPSLFSPTS